MLNALYLELIVVCIGVLMLLAESFLGRGASRTPVALAGALGLLVVLVLTAFAGIPPESAGWPAWQFYAPDPQAMFFKQIALAVTILVLLMSADFVPVLRKFIPGEHPNAGLGEFYALPVLICAGLMWMASAVHFLMIFAAIELVTITFYIMVGYQRRNLLSLEAGVKYLILGALSTGFLVYGITWIYGLTGSFHLETIAMRLPEVAEGDGKALLFGFGLVLIGLLFKVGAAPFHIWIPDVYQGAAAPVTAFLSVGSKAAGFIVLLRVLECAFASPLLRAELAAALPWFAVLSLVVGNLAALPQNNAKRLLGYSSIAHAGFLLMAVAAVFRYGQTGPAIAFYLGAYLLMTALAFHALTLVTAATGSDEIAAFNGLARRSPFLAFAMTVALLSLAGIPLTAGFFGKLFVFIPAIQAGLTPLVVVGALGVAAGLYYYLKIIRAMFWLSPDDETPIKIGNLSTAVLSVLSALVIGLGFLPLPLMALAGF